MGHSFHRMCCVDYIFYLTGMTRPKLGADAPDQAHKEVA